MIQHFVTASGHLHNDDANGAETLNTKAREAGWWLKREREQVGARIEDVVAATRIHPNHISALEEGRLEALPERERALDLIWAYADFLMLEPGPLCAHFGKLLPAPAPRRTLEVHQTEFKGTGMMARFLTPRIASGPMIGAGCVAMLAVAGIAWLAIPSSDSSSGDQLAGVPEIEAPAVDSIVTGAIPDKKTLPQAKPKIARKDSDLDLSGGAEGQSDLTDLIKRTLNASAKKPVKKKATATKKKQKVSAKPKVPVGQVYGAANKNSRIFIQAESRVYVRIEDAGGTVIFNQTLNAGDGFKVPNRKGLVLVARDGGALRYVVDGKRSGKLGTPGDILVGRSLNIEDLGKSG
ncbi:MAG: RodZ domain-containing protein [Hyphomicrobiales bacterium]